MKLKSFSYLYCLLIIFLYFSPLKSEEKIDIWKNDKKKDVTTEINKIEKYLKDYLKNVKKYSESTVIPFAEFFDYENETNAPKYHLTQIENDKCQFINCIQTDEYFNLKMKQYKLRWYHTLPKYVPIYIVLNSS
jgi:hypothetical protein